MQEAIREIDESSWLIDDKLLLLQTPQSGCTWRDGNGMGYKITKAVFPLPASRPLSKDGHVQLIYDAGDVSAVFAIGNSAFCKVRILDVPNVTREHVTLDWLHQRTWSFTIPHTLYHAEYDGRYYIVLGRVAGMTIDSVWASLDETAREYYAARVSDICRELTVPAELDTISGVDGQFLSERYLCRQDIDCSPQNLRKSCEELGMDYANLAFYHCDLGSTNILVDLQNASIAIIDWETAGFVPVEWIRTKFRVSSGMNLSSGDQVDWRRRVMLQLGEAGFKDVAEVFMKWNT